MNKLYKKEINTSYLILEKTGDISEFAMNMLQENQIPGLLSFEKRSFNGEESFYYDISGKYTLENLTKMRPLKEGDIKGLLESLLSTMQTCSSYFLDSSCLSLEFDLIFEKEGIYSFCYYPVNCPANKGRQEDMEEKIKVFGEKLISCVDHDDEQAVTLVYQFYRLAKENTLTTAQILHQLLMEAPEKKEIKEDLSIDEEIDIERISLYDFSDEAGDKKERKAREEENIKKEQSESPDYLSVVIFVILAVGSLSYFVYRFMNTEAFSLETELFCREGILAAVFLVLSVPGIFLSLYPLRKLQRIKAIFRRA